MSKIPKRYEIVTKPTTEAFCKGKHTESKVVSEEWLELSIKAVERDPNVERYTVKELKK